MEQHGGAFCAAQSEPSFKTQPCSPGCSPPEASKLCQDTERSLNQRCRLSNFQVFIGSPVVATLKSAGNQKGTLIRIGALCRLVQPAPQRISKVLHALDLVSNFWKMFRLAQWLPPDAAFRCSGLATLARETAQRRACGGAWKGKLQLKKYIAADVQGFDEVWAQATRTGF